MTDTEDLKTHLLAEVAACAALDALETVRGLLPRTAAVRVLTAWRDLESLPALRRAAACGTQGAPGPARARLDPERPP